MASGTTYQAVVTPFEIVDGKEVYLSEKITITATTGPGKVTWKNIKKSGNTSAKLTWKKMNGAIGYEIYMKAGSGKFKKIKTVKKGKTVTFKKNGLKANTKYQFKIRAYSKIDGEKVYGEYSKVKKFTIKI